MKAVGYARISKDDRLEGRGVQRQSEDIAEVCERHQWELVEVLTDNDVSASRYSTKARPGYARLLGLIESGAVDRAVVYDVDRLLRQPRELEDLIDLCESRNGAFELHNVNGELDLMTGSGRFVARVLVGKAAMESDDLSRRLKRSFDQKAAEGLPHGARAFGYEPDGMTVRASEAELFVQAADDVLEGTSLNEIARRWNGMGVLTPQRQRLWSGTVVKAVLTNPRHAGLRVHRREVVGPGKWPPLIDRDKHERLVAHLTARRARRPPRRTAFTGLITDPDGVPLDRDVVRGRPSYRGHRRPGREAAPVQIAAEPLERLILEMMFSAIDEGKLSQVAQRQRSRRVAAPDLASIEEDLRGLAEDFGEGRISRGEWLAARGPLEARLQAAQAVTKDQCDADLSAELTVELRDRWPDLDVDRQREILRLVFRKIVIHPALKRGGPQPMIDGIGRIDARRVDPDWRV